MADFSAIKAYLEKNNLSYYTFFPKSEKPIKPVTHHLHQNTPAEDISDGLVSLGFDVISVKQMTTTRRSHTEGASTSNIPLFLITLPRTSKSQDIFRLTGLCHIAIKVEEYKAQSGLTQCYNCQQFGHVWANCKIPPLCGAGADTCTKNARKKGRLPLCQAAATASCWKVKTHTPPTLGAAGTKTQRTPKTTTGRVFSSNLTTPGVSFAAALRGSTAQQQDPQACHVPVADPLTGMQSRKPAPGQQQEPGQSFRAQNVNSQPLDNTLRVVTVVQQIMTEFNGAVSEEEKILAITKIVLNLMKHNGH
jgi:hypothetical protein